MALLRSSVRIRYAPLTGVPVSQPIFHLPIPEVIHRHLEENGPDEAQAALHRMKGLYEIPNPILSQAQRMIDIFKQNHPSPHAQ